MLFNNYGNGLKDLHNEKKKEPVIDNEDHQEEIIFDPDDKNRSKNNLRASGEDHKESSVVDRV